MEGQLVWPLHSKWHEWAGYTQTADEAGASVSAVESVYHSFSVAAKLFTGEVLPCAASQDFVTWA